MSQSRYRLPLRALPALLATLGIIVLLCSDWSLAFEPLSALTAATGPLQSEPASLASTPCGIETRERIVAIGDVHGAYDEFVGILRTTGLIDGRERWTGGRAIFVQTGDVLDRGAQSRRVLDLLRRLEPEAARAGGRVHALLGNHEVMRMTGDWRYVSAGEYAAFRTPGSAEVRQRGLAAATENAAQQAQRDGKAFDASAFRDQFMIAIPLGSLEMARSFDPAGDYGRWLRTHDTLVAINGIVFVHGGISPAVASMGCASINATVRREIAGGVPSADTLATMLASSPTGPLWYRGLAEEPEATFSPALGNILADMKARAIVTGHSPTSGRITARFDGRVVQIDTGMLGGDVFPGGRASALDIRGDTAVAVYTDRREPIRLPARASAAAAR